MSPSIPQNQFIMREPLRTVRPKKHIFDMPLEILRKIFRHLPENLHVQVHPADLTSDQGLRRVPYTTLSNVQCWHQLLSCALVSKTFARCLLEALKWATARKEIQIKVNISKADLRPEGDPRQTFRFRFGQAAQGSCIVPRQVLRAFQSVEMRMPVLLVRHGNITEDMSLKEVQISVEKPAGRSDYRVNSSVWSSISSAQHHTSALYFANAMEWIEMCFGTLVSQRGYAGLSANVLHDMAMSLGDRTIRHCVSGSGYRLLSTRSTVQCMLLREKNLLLLSSVKLGWRGTPPVETPAVNRDAVSFMTKWRPCAELINARRWEEPKVVKLGWRGSRIVADARRREWEAGASSGQM